MQNSKIKVLEFNKTPLRIFMQKLRIAYNVLKSKQSIVIIDNEIDAFNHSPEEVISITGKICIHLKQKQELQQAELQDQLINQAIHNLVYN